MQEPFDQFDQDFYCPICTELALNAVQSKCCKGVFCQECSLSVKRNKEINSCPLCRNQQFQYAPAKIREKINNLLKRCEHCKEQFILLQFKSHKKECMKAPVKCSRCNKVFKKDQIVKHTLNQHQEAVIKLIDLLHKDSFQIPYAQFNINEMLNQSGRMAYLGITGKFYCQGKLTGSCQCCNGFCGPTNGQNCTACMKLDIKRRGLRKGFLVNGQGFVCWKQNDSFRCQKMLNDRSGHCTDGSICRFCQNINKTSINRYYSLLQSQIKN